MIEVPEMIIQLLKTHPSIQLLTFMELPFSLSLCYMATYYIMKASIQQLCVVHLSLCADISQMM